ncbi:hypothetical protein ACFLT7_01350 [candidate division KSB1 bacterium]
MKKTGLILLLILGRLGAVSGTETTPPTWAAPLPGGPIRALIISDIIPGRAVRELAERMDLAPQVIFLDSDWALHTGLDFPERFNSSLHLPGDRLYTAALNELEELVSGNEDFEVIVIPTFLGWDRFPLPIRQAIHRRVVAGAGLVLFRPYSNSPPDGFLEELSPFSGGAPDNLNANRHPSRLNLVSVAAPWRATAGEGIIETLPSGAGGLEHLELHLSEYGLAPGARTILADGGNRPILAVRQAGKGRSAAFSFDSCGLLPRIRRTDPLGEIRADTWESYWLLLTRTIYWASGRTRNASIQTAELSLPEDEAGGESGLELKVSLAGPVSSLTLRAWSRPESPTTTKGTAGPAVEVKIKEAKAGEAVRLRVPCRWEGDRTFVDFQLMKASEVIDWGSKSLTRPTPLDNAAILPGGTSFVQGNPVLVGLELASSAGGEFKLETELWDGWGRLQEKETIIIPVEGRLSILPTLPSSNIRSRSARAVFRIYSGDDQIKVLSQPVIVRPARHIRGDWSVFQPYTPRNYGGMELPWSSETDGLLREAGINITDDPLGPFQFFVRAQRNWERPAWLFYKSGAETPEGASLERYLELKRDFLDSRDPYSLVHDDPCLSDKESEEKLIRGYTDWVKRMVALGPQAYEFAYRPSLTSGSDPLDLCRARYCTKWFGKYLFDFYENLDRFNRVWRGDYTNWKIIRPLVTEEARRDGLLIRWEDHRTYNEINLSARVRLLKDIIKKEDPGSLVGLAVRGEDGVHNGIDPGRLDPMLDFWGDPGAVDRFRFNGDGLVLGLAKAGEASSDAAGGPWRALAAGYGGYRLPPLFLMLDPESEPRAETLDLLASLKEIDRGPGRLMAESEADPPVVLIHHSMRSLHLAWLADGRIEAGLSGAREASPTFDLILRNREAWGMVLDHLGVSWRLVSSDEISSGVLDPQWHRAVILPNSMVITAEEKEALSIFRDQGGYLIADGRTGIFNEALTVSDPDLVAELFGIERGPDESLGIKLERPRRVSSTGKDGPVGKAGGLYLRLIEKPYRARDGSRVLAECSTGPAIISSADGHGIYINGLISPLLESDCKPAHKEALLEMGEWLMEKVLVKPRFRITDAAGRRRVAATRIFNLGEFDIIGVVEQEKPGGGSPEILINLGKNYYHRELTGGVGGKLSGADSRVGLNLEPRGAALCLISAVPPEDLDIKYPANIKRGEDVSIMVTSSGDGILADGYPLALTGYRPNGGEEVGLRSTSFGDGVGEVVFRFRPALNDQPGERRLVLTDLYSGRDYPLSIRVE